MRAVGISTSVSELFGVENGAITQRFLCLAMAPMMTRKSRFSTKSCALAFIRESVLRSKADGSGFASKTAGFHVRRQGHFALHPRLPYLDKDQMPVNKRIHDAIRELLLEELLRMTYDETAMTLESQPGRCGHAGHAAGHQRGMRQAGGAHRPRPEGADQPALDLRPQELLLSRPAAGLPDQPVQGSDRRRGRDRHRADRTASSTSRSASSACIWNRTPASRCTTSIRRCPMSISTARAWR
jgi:hypothetical protein